MTPFGKLTLLLAIVEAAWCFNYYSSNPGRTYCLRPIRSADKISWGGGGVEYGPQYVPQYVPQYGPTQQYCPAAQTLADPHFAGGSQYFTVPQHSAVSHYPASSQYLSSSGQFLSSPTRYSVPNGVSQYQSPATLSRVCRDTNAEAGSEKPSEVADKKGSGLSHSVADGALNRRNRQASDYETQTQIDSPVSDVPEYDESYQNS